MRCIYLDENDVCKAQPHNVGIEYKPEAETLNNLCKHAYDMKGCPRLLTYQEHLKSLKSE